MWKLPKFLQFFEEHTTIVFSTRHLYLLMKLCKCNIVIYCLDRVLCWLCWILCRKDWKLLHLFKYFLYLFLHRKIKCTQTSTYRWKKANAPTNPILSWCRETGTAFILVMKGSIPRDQLSLWIFLCFVTLYSVRAQLCTQLTRWSLSCTWTKERFSLSLEAITKLFPFHTGFNLVTSDT